MMTRKKYDVIISEPSNPWIAGEAALFTKEYFELARDKLTSGGVFCCWLQGYQLAPEQFKSVMRTIGAVFESVTLWETLNTVDYMLIGSKQPIRIDPILVEKRMKMKGVAEDLARVYVTEVGDLFGKFIMGPRGFEMAAGEGDYHVDDRLQLEYAAPRCLYQSEHFYPEFYKKVVRYSEHPHTIISIPEQNWPEGLAAAINNETIAQDTLQMGLYFNFSGRRIEALDYLAEAVRMSPRNEWYKEVFKVACKSIGQFLVEEQKLNEALALFIRAVQLVPRNAALHGQLGVLYMMLNKGEEAGKHFEKAVELDPYDAVAMYNLGFLYLKASERVAAMEMFQRAVEIKPDYERAYNAMGTIAVQEQRLSEAAEYFLKAIENDPYYVDAYVNLGKVLIQNRKDKKKRKKGCIYLKKALSLDPVMKQNEDFIRILNEECK